MENKILKKHRRTGRCPKTENYRAESDLSLIELFQIFFNNQIWDIICEQSNKCANSKRLTGKIKALKKYCIDEAIVPYYGRHGTK